MNDELLEKLADLEHEQWAHWTKYMLTKLAPLLNPVRMVGMEEYDEALECLDRWQRQIQTPYAELTEAEKDSDREWARKIIDIVEGSHGPT